MVFVAVSVRPGSFLFSRGGTQLFSGAGTLAFAIRSGVNLILLLARIQRVRGMSRFVRDIHFYAILIVFVQKDAYFADINMPSLALSVSAPCLVCPGP